MVSISDIKVRLLTTFFDKFIKAFLAINMPTIFLGVSKKKLITKLAGVGPPSAPGNQNFLISSLARFGVGEEPEEGAYPRWPDL